MEQLRAVLQQADDDYLTGLSNKGIVKRAYKDLEGETPSLAWQGETAEVTLKSESCVIRNPLGESSCSCPSSSICRHVVTAILWLKGQMGQDEKGEDGDQSVSENQDNPDDEGGQSSESGTGNRAEEFLAVSVEHLKRACGSRRFQALLTHIKYGEQPELSETSIVTVTIPWEQATVRLISPLKYSTCTCHSKELCAHKAQALLIYQIKHGKVSLKDLENMDVPENVVNMEAMKAAAAKVREHILDQLETGLSRQSPEVEESLERLAIICHRAQLADFESRLREIASNYHQYFRRSAAFRSQELLNRILALYALAGRVLKAETSGELSSLAGSFRSDYEPIGRLKLTGMGARSFSSKTGYEGEIYYFLETEHKKWYTWTDARPTFYEGTRRRPSSSTGRTEAPWGLACSREQLAELDFELTNAKAASGGRLSASQDTKGEILGQRDLNDPGIQELIYMDYERLLEDYFGPRRRNNCFADGPDSFGDGESPERDGGEDAEGSLDGSGASAGRRERLALVWADGWEEPAFDYISQKFSWGIHDRKGRTIFVSLRYTKEEKLIIAMLERLEQRLKRREVKSLLFFGSVYLENGRLCLFPIEFFRHEPAAKEESAKGPGTELQAAAPSEADGMTAAIPDVMEQYRQEAVRTLSDLLASGLSSVREDVLFALAMLAEDGRRLGLSLAGEEFSAVGEMLGSRRHRMEFTSEPVADAMERLDRYLTACGEKLSFDRARYGMEP